MMPRESFADNSIPANGTADVPYSDKRGAVRGVFLHAAEMYIGKITGAGGVGGSLLNVPFEPAVIRCINQAGATPVLYESVFASDGAVHLSIILAAAANATPPVVTRVGEGDFTVALPTAMAPNAEVVTVICIGCRDAGGSL